jgi:hypothetical protein
MIRNTRAVVALKLPRRHATTIRVDGVDGERAIYLDLAAAVRDLAAQGTARHRLELYVPVQRFEVLIKRRKGGRLIRIDRAGIPGEAR